MLKITNYSHSFYNNVDFELENGILLFEKDWNGEIYGTGFNPGTGKDDGLRYIPIYDELKNDQYEIVGFETY